MNVRWLLLVLLFPWTLTASEHLAVGTPGECDQTLTRTGYALGYSVARKQPLWVQYHFTKSRNKSRKYSRDGVEFLPDPDLVAGASALEDYKHPIYDRGHLAPAADMQYSKQAMKECFYLSNMSPQHREMNAGIWADIEKFVRYTVNVEKEIYVISGPLFGEQPKTIGPNQVAIPEAYYKVIYDVTPPEKMIAFSVPNYRCNQPLKTFVTTVDAIEERTGLDFFSALPVEHTAALEASIDPAAWKRLNSWYRENLFLPWER